ncbi:MAG: DUF6850 family outer membrane beta-barrel protein [Bacteroidales bacterium]|nr:hypothetical protein [Bacteroidales bacterium]
MKSKLIYISSVIVICLLPNLLYSQQWSPKRHYTFEKIETKNPWLQSGNAAGLVFNKAQNFSNLEGFYTNESGDYRNFNDPENYSTYGIETKSYSKINNVYFYGSFKYDYGVNKNLAWRGTVYPESNLNPIVDSIPGKVLRESYIMSAKVGYNLTDHISIGAEFDYNASTAAKRTDGRNLNTLSMLTVSPGIIFRTNKVKVGLNLTYDRDVEEAKYKYIGETTGKEIYYMEGLWFYTAQGITNTTNLDRKYIRDIFGGAVQAHFRSGKLCIFNQFSAKFGQEDDGEDNNYTKRYAYVESLNYKYDGRFRLVGQNVDHILSLSFLSKENLSYNVVTNYERVPDELNQWEFYEYGKTLRYMTNYQKYGAEYKTFFKDDEWRSTWIFAAGINHLVSEKEYKVYPAHYKQDFSLNEIYVRASRDLDLNQKSFLNVELNGGYTTTDGTMLEATNPLTTGALKLNESILNKDFEYYMADRYSVGIGAKYSRMLNIQKGSAVYLKANYKHMDAGDLGTRGFFALSLGLNF